MTAEWQEEVTVTNSFLVRPVERFMGLSGEFRAYRGRHRMVKPWEGQWREVYFVEVPQHGTRKKARIAYPRSWWKRIAK